ncbi:MAG TPA: hypothetical protein PLN52_26200, partial [Opitutaceae bacterium]|nr:hypothetical protein [Opitutaceae bacterium]
KAALKKLNDRPEFAELEVKARKEDEAYAAAAQDIADRFAMRADELRYRLTELYEECRRKDLPDYPIFMAIAEDIGYDTTGHETGANELEVIAKELRQFISWLETKDEA